MRYLVILLIAFFSINSYSQVPTHCTQNEFSLLNAKMGKLEKDKFKSNEKILSLCADKAKEPYGSLAYRYGKIGAVEIENISTTQSKMFVYFEQTTPKTSDNAMWFKKGNFTYVVKECMGMCDGIYLFVFQNGKKIAELISPNQELYDSNITNITMEKIKSPIFVNKNPEVNLN